MVFASSSVTFPTKHEKISPYPGNYKLAINGPSGIRDGANYTLKCNISNPNDYETIIKFEFDQFTYCKSLGGCGSLSLDGKSTNNMLHLSPGNHEIKKTSLLTSNYHPVTNLVLTNYDNDGAVFVEQCSADLE